MSLKHDPDHHHLNQRDKKVFILEMMLHCRDMNDDGKGECRGGKGTRRKLNPNQSKTRYQSRFKGDVEPDMEDKEEVVEGEAEIIGLVMYLLV
jgi:hypothetical protein